MSAGTPSAASTSPSTPRLFTLMPTSALLSPTRLKKVVTAASSSASASTPAAPQMSMFHWKCSRRLVVMEEGGRARVVVCGETAVRGMDGWAWT